MDSGSENQQEKKNCIQLTKLCSHAFALNIAHLQFNRLHQLKQFLFFVANSQFNTQISIAQHDGWLLNSRARV